MTRFAPRLPGRTLRGRIVWSTAVVGAVAMAAVIGTVLLVLSALTQKSIDSTLHDRFGAVAATLSTNRAGTITQLETPDDAIDDRTWIFDTSGLQINGPRAGKRVQAEAESFASTRKEVTVDSRDRVYLAAPVLDGESGKVNAVVVVTESMKPYESTRLAVILGLVGLGLVVTIGSAAIAAWTMRRALEPVESMAVRAEDWSEHDLDSRFDDNRGDDEISQLGRTLNVLLDRVAGAIRNEQQLTSELAHELRTPLTAIRGEAELGIMATTEDGTGERLERVVDLTDRMNSTISTLLAIARGQSPGGTRTDAASIVASVVADLPPSNDVVVDVAGIPPALQAAVPEELAVRALSPVVVNAVQHARSSVTVTAHQNARMIEITVSDDGDGLDDVDEEDLFSAGVRHRDSPGAGLGLSLSRRVARTLGGDVVVSSASAPTSFTIYLPRY